MRTALVCGLAAFLLLLAACGGGDDDASSGDDGTGEENGLAQSMLLTADDFPSGWTETPADDSDDSPLEECEAEEAGGKTGEADSGDFSEGGTASVSQQISIFEEPETVTERLALFDDIADCAVEKMNEGALDTDEVTFADASITPLQFGDYGDELRAYRLEATGTATNEDEEAELPVYIDIVLVVIGRVGMTIQGSDVFSPFDADALEAVVSRATEKVERTLAAQ